MARNTITCEWCDMRMPADVRVCPHCGEKVIRPIYKRGWVWALVLLLVAGAAFQYGVRPLAAKMFVPQEYKDALRVARTYASQNCSREGIFLEMTAPVGGSFSPEAVNYALDNINVDWKGNALSYAQEQAASGFMSRQAIYNTLVSDYYDAYYGRFTEEEAQYAMDHVFADWNEIAMNLAQGYAADQHMSEKAIYNQLVNNDLFTPEEAQYAVDHTDVYWNEIALKAAQEYESYDYLARNELFRHLYYSSGCQFTEEQAQYAVDHLDTDWKENALQAGWYLYGKKNTSQADTYADLISYDYGFTEEEAQYAIDHMDTADWKENALQTARTLRTLGYSFEDIALELTNTNLFSEEVVRYAMDNLD